VRIPSQARHWRSKLGSEMAERTTPNEVVEFFAREPDAIGRHARKGAMSALELRVGLAINGMRTLAVVATGRRNASSAHAAEWSLRPGARHTCSKPAARTSKWLDTRM
jgi:hypothetical protein